MADSGIKNVIILKNSLPALNSDTEKYIIRYRIVSEDKNRISHWSPQFYLSPIALSIDQYADISIVKTPGIVTVTWKDSEISKSPKYEIYTQWGIDEEMESENFYTIVTGNFAVIPIPEGKNSLRLWIQSESLPQSRVNSLTITSSYKAAGNIDGIISVA